MIECSSEMTKFLVLLLYKWHLSAKKRSIKDLKNILRKKVEWQDEKAVTFMLIFNWIRGMLWYLPKKIQGKDCWESLRHRKAYWTFSFNIARMYLEIMEMMMSCVLNIGTITITSNWFAKSKRHARQTAIFRRHINKNPKYKGESSSNGDLVMTEDGQYYSEGEMIQSVTIHS